jgi:K+ transporter
MHGFLKFLAVFGVSLIIADGILTPAQSILGAIQGITVVSSDLTYHTVVGVSCAILVVLFLVQPLGITKISSAWAPIIIIWFVFNFCFGVYVRSQIRILVNRFANRQEEPRKTRLGRVESIFTLFRRLMVRS